MLAAETLVVEQVEPSVETVAETLVVEQAEILAVAVAVVAASSRARRT